VRKARTGDERRMEAKKIVLAYSGGLDTSALLKYLQEMYHAGIIAVTADVGEGRDLDEVRERALKVGALEAHTLDLKDEFAESYVLPALKINALYVNGARVLDSRPAGLYHD